jgi:hypothetical protein
MGGLGLLTGLLVPWVAGALVLAVLLRQPGLPGHRLRLAGFGLLFGLAAVAWSLRLLDAWTGTLPVGWVLATLAIAAALALWRLRLANSQPDLPVSINTNYSSYKVRWLLPLLLGLAGLHLLFSAIEILVQPMFPWDGWTVWVYRAKAWFFSGELAPIVSKQAWLGAESAATFSTPALAYPLLPSLMPLWAAICLGGWHESLINLPVLLVGLGVALGLAGCVRGSDAGPLAATVAAYLLLSTPLFGVHLSLGGYGDIWMAAYAGLGMTAVLWGLVERRREGLVIGMCLLLVATGVKVEGWIWFLLGVVAILLSSLRGRILAAIAGGAAALVALAWVTGWTVVDTPGLGQIGFRNGNLYVPFKGIIRLERIEVGDAYLNNAFAMGNWHLLWVMAGTALVALAFGPRQRLARVALAFFLPFVLVQGVIFGLTTQGAWARDYTAINRMPLQMLPAVLYLLVLTAQRAWARATASNPSRLVRGTAGAGLAALLITGAAAVAWLGTDAGPEVPPKPLDGAGLDFVAGGGKRAPDRISIERYQDGIALLSTGQVRVDPVAYTQLIVDIDAVIDPAEPERAPAFFWRRADQPREVSRLTLDRPGRFDLSRSPDWRGEIVEMGFFFLDSAGEPVTLLEARLEGRTLGNRLLALPGQWTHFETWSQQSVHFLWGGEARQSLPLTALVAVFSLLAGLIGVLLLGRAGAAVPVTAMLLAGWVVLDARWLGDRFRQAELSLAWWRASPIEERLAAGEPGTFYAYLDRLKREQLGAEPARIVVVGDPRLEKYFPLRAKYQLLPHSSIVSRRPPAAHRLQTVDYVLFLGPFIDGDPAAARRDSDEQLWRRLGLTDRDDLRGRLELVERDDQGTLFRVR